ncbi:transcriptional regulator NrdR [Candidatus Woesearchaeota archaeon CG10_big_fil_rev_8_21_14_0_10_44_13]|nr:MAG: transcriptional regulator NrdR [Candidatus Woesearchaeota archaeon CG10_big_fil_rev_8_21_14_0_10_44_13]
MRCPYCSHAESKVMDKRDSPDSSSIKRRRECLKCSKRFTTYENFQISLSVIKKDGSKQEFDREKILLGMRKACEKRPISDEMLAGMVDDIESDILNKGKKEIPARSIGDIVMKKLKKTDDVAYLRFASVYKEFNDPKSFEEELGKLKK